MTLKELNSYHVVKANIERCRDKIREIDGRTISSPIFDTSGIPKSPTAHNSVEERYIKALSDKERYERHIAEDEAIIQRIEAYISSIKDRRTRMIFEMHVYDAETFWKIAMKFGGRNSEEGVKNVFYRYLKEHPHG